MAGGIVPRIGLMAVGLGSYWAQFPGMRDGVLAAHARLTGLFARAGEIVAAGLVDTADAAQAAGETFRSRGVDIVFCHLTTYANSETLLPAVRDLDVPVVLLNVQPVRALDMDQVKGIADWLGVACTCAGLPEMTAVLIRLGKRFDTITGHLDGDADFAERISDWCAVAGLRRRLRNDAIALIGRPFAGMLDLNVDETHLFRRFGTYVRHLDWQDVLAERDEVTDAERAAAAELLSATFSVPESFTRADLDEAATLLAMFRRFASRHRLCAIASHYEGPPSGATVDAFAAGNPALSLLMADGIACPVEGDMKVAIAMVTLKALAGCATLAELYSMDFDDDVAIIGHSGAGDPAVSTARRPVMSVSDVFHGKSGRGYLTQFFPGAGPATMLSLTQDAAGDYRFVATELTIEDGPTLRLGDTNCRARSGCGMRDFIRRWSALGPTHHGVLARGRHLDRLRIAATGLGVPIDVVAA